MDDLRIRKAIEADLEKLAELDRQSGLTPWSAGQYGALFRRPDCDVFAALLPDGSLAGFLLNLRLGFEAELLRVAVAPESRGKGIGQALLDRGIESVRQVGCTMYFLEVRPSNAAARSLYRKNGFVESGLRKGYYQNPPEDALVMRKTL